MMKKMKMGQMLLIAAILICAGMLFGCTDSKAKQESQKASASARSETLREREEPIENKKLDSRELETWGKYQNLVGKTLAEIKREYGKVLLDDYHYWNGGRLYRVKGMQLWLSFTREGDISVFDRPKNTDVCLVMEGTLSTFFNNIKNRMTPSELQNLLGVHLTSSEDDSEGEFVYADKLPDGNVMYIFLEKGIATPQSTVLIKREE